MTEMQQDQGCMRFAQLSTPQHSTALAVEFSTERLKPQPHVGFLHSCSTSCPKTSTQPQLNLWHHCTAHTALAARNDECLVARRVKKDKPDAAHCQETVPLHTPLHTPLHCSCTCKAKGHEQTPHNAATPQQTHHAPPNLPHTPHATQPSTQQEIKTVSPFKA